MDWMVGRGCEEVEDATHHHLRTQGRSRAIQEMKGPTQVPCLNSKLSSFLLAPGWACDSHVSCQTPALPRHRCLHLLPSWMECLGNNKQPSLVDGGLLCEKWLEISLESELSQEGTGEPLRVIGGTGTRSAFCFKRVFQYFSTLSGSSG